MQSLMVDLPPKGGVQPSALYLNDGTGNFKNVAVEAGFQAASIMGATYVDWDLDGDPDVVLGPGSHPLLNMQPLMLYRNDGVRDGIPRFTLVTDLDDPHWYGKFHGMAFGDPDHDGDPDMMANNGGVMLSDQFIDLYLENDHRRPLAPPAAQGHEVERQRDRSPHRGRCRRPHADAGSRSRTGLLIDHDALPDLRSGRGRASGCGSDQVAHRETRTLPAPLQTRPSKSRKARRRSAGCTEPAGAALSTLLPSWGIHLAHSKPDPVHRPGCRLWRDSTPFIRGAGGGTVEDTDSRLDPRKTGSDHPRRSRDRPRVFGLLLPVRHLRG